MTLPTAATSDVRRARAFARQGGFSMLEVLISIMITVVGLLGLIGMQAVAARAELESYQRAQALVLLNDMVERINTNRGSAACYAFTSASTGTPYLGTSTGGNYLGTPNCSGGYVNTQTKTLADNGMYAWDQLLQGAAESSSAGTAIGAMIGARGCVSYDSSTLTYTVVVTWQGMSDTFAPVVNCANNLYGAETKRRAVWTTLRIATLS